MELRIVEKKENKLLKRAEISFELGFDKAVPARKEVRDALSTSLGANPELIVIVKIKNRYGTRSAKGMAHAYKDKAAMGVEKKHLLVREGLAQKVKKVEAPKKAPAKK